MPVRSLLRATFFAVFVGVAAGLGSAAFLALLDLATSARLRFPLLIFFLPLAGAAMGLARDGVGASVKRGTNLVLDATAVGGAQVPLRLAPIVLFGTVLTHLFGGSAGREGTAVQIGGACADTIAHRAHVDVDARRLLVQAGIAGGFGAVFGTPFAGAIFAIEVVRIGRWDLVALAPALVAATIGDVVTRAVGIQHTHYPRVIAPSWSPMLVGKWITLGLAIALVAFVFTTLTHAIQKLLERVSSRAWLRMALGGALVVALYLVVRNPDYLGLGVPTIVRAFVDASLPKSAFAWKLLFTAVTIGAGFLGGEVTPLFFVGAALGNALAHPLGLPLDAAVGVALAGMFAVAANAPLALAIMAGELLGFSIVPHALLAATVGWLAFGHRGIYPSQRIARFKGSFRPAPGEPTLHDYGGRW